MSSMQSDYGIKWIFFKNKNILVHGENKINVNAMLLLVVVVVIIIIIIIIN